LILPASAHPDQISEAALWLEGNAGAVDRNAPAHGPTFLQRVLVVPMFGRNARPPVQSVRPIDRPDRKRGRSVSRISSRRSALPTVATGCAATASCTRPGAQPSRPQSRPHGPPQRPQAQRPGGNNRPAAQRPQANRPRPQQGARTHSQRPRPQTGRNQRQ